MATRADVIALAQRRLGILAADEQPDADSYEYCNDVLVSLFAEISADVTISWDLDTVPDASAVPLGNLLATEVAQHYAVQSEPRSRAWSRFRAAVIDDDRDDLRDLDDDGSVSAGEQAAWDRSVYY